MPVPRSSSPAGPFTPHRAPSIAGPVLAPTPETGPRDRVNRTFEYVYADLEIADHIRYRKQPHSTHRDAVELFRYGYDISAMVDQVQDKAGRPAIEQHLLHALRICKPGTFHDSDIRRLLPQIEESWNLEMYVTVA